MSTGGTGGFEADPNCANTSKISVFLLQDHVKITSVVLAVTMCVIKKLNGYCESAG